MGYQVWQYVVHVSIVLNICLQIMMTFIVTTWDWMWVMAYTCDLISFANIVVSFFVVYIDDRGVTYYDCRTIARRYFFLFLFFFSGPLRFAMYTMSPTHLF